MKSHKERAYAHLVPRPSFVRRSWLATSLRLALVLVTGTGLLGLAGCNDDDASTVVAATGSDSASAPTLSGFTLSVGQLSPAFSSGTTSYSATVIAGNSFTVTPTAASGTITVNGTTVSSGTASGAISLPAGISTITVAVTEPAGTTTYTITVHQLAQEAYVKASNTGAGDYFGYSVALSGDTLAVGALNEDSAATGIGGNQADNSAGDSGAVYVFTRSGATWTQQAYVKASNTGASDDFGTSVALSGDTLVVGGPYESSNATGIGGDQANNLVGSSGAVYVIR